MLSKHAADLRTNFNILYHIKIIEWYISIGNSQQNSKKISKALESYYKAVVKLEVLAKKYQYNDRMIKLLGDIYYQIGNCQSYVYNHQLLTGEAFLRAYRAYSCLENSSIDSIRVTASNAALYLSAANSNRHSVIVELCNAAIRLTTDPVQCDLLNFTKLKSLQYIADTQKAIRKLSVGILHSSSSTLEMKKITLNILLERLDANLPRTINLFIDAVYLESAKVKKKELLLRLFSVILLNLDQLKTYHDQCEFLRLFLILKNNYIPSLLYDVHWSAKIFTSILNIAMKHHQKKLFKLETQEWSLLLLQLGGRKSQSRNLLESVVESTRRFAKKKSLQRFYNEASLELHMRLAKAYCLLGNFSAAQEIINSQYVWIDQNHLQPLRRRYVELSAKMFMPQEKFLPLHANALTDKLDQLDGIAQLKLKYHRSQKKCKFQMLAKFHAMSMFATLPKAIVPNSDVLIYSYPGRK